MSYYDFLFALRKVGACEIAWAIGEEFMCTRPVANAMIVCDINAAVRLLGGEKIIAKNGDLTEAVRFAENLRRVLDGEPSLEVERLQKALDQATESMWIETMGVERNVDANTQDAWRYPLEDVIIARAGNGYAIIGRVEDNPELAAELKRRVGEVNK